MTAARYWTLYIAVMLVYAAALLLLGTWRANAGAVLGILVVWTLGHLAARRAR